MKISIFQVNTARDRNRVAFMGFDTLKELQGYQAIDCDIYDRVYDGEVECKTLEDVYRVFNIDHPKGYKGRSLSVSDVVGVEDEADETTYWFCDTCGFVKVKFNPSVTAEPGEEVKKANKKTVTASSLDERARLLRKYDETGGRDIFIAAIKVSEAISRELFGTSNRWCQIVDFIAAMTGSCSLKNCTDTEIHDVWRALGFEVIEK